MNSLICISTHYGQWVGYDHWWTYILVFGLRWYIHSVVHMHTYTHIHVCMCIHTAVHWYILVYYCTSLLDTLECIITHLHWYRMHWCSLPDSLALAWAQCDCHRLVEKKKERVHQKRCLCTINTTSPPTLILCMVQTWNLCNDCGEYS